MNPPVSSTEDNPRARRETAILEKLKKNSKAQGVTQNNEQENNIQSLQMLVEGAARKVQQLEEGLDKRRAVRCGLEKGGHALQVLTSSLSEFVKAYPGIGDISKGANAHYGGLVIGTLSVLLQIGENKNGRETAINSAFAELMNSWLGDLGRLSLYTKALQPSQRMDEFLADVYLGIGELAVDSQRYYLRPSYVRFWQAIRRPPKLGIDRKVDDIKKAIFEVVLEGNAHLVNSHSQLVEHVKEQSRLTDRHRAQEREDKLRGVERRLGIDWATAEPDKVIVKCKGLHTNAFAISTRRRASKKLQQISLKLILDSKVYKQWNEATESSVLILSGSNFDNYETGLLLCWLSPITTELGRAYLSGQLSLANSKVLFFSACQDEASRRSIKKGLLADCFSNLILQMLHWNTDYVDKNLQSVCEDMKDSVLRRESTLKRLLEACNCFDQVYIIIDRLDCITAPDDDDDDSDEDSVGKVLEALLEIVCAASCKVRLIITIHSDKWPGVKNDADMDGRWKTWKRQLSLEHYSMFCKIGWKQLEAQEW